MNRKFVALGELLAVSRNGVNADQFDQPIGDMLPISRIETISDGTINFLRVKYAKVGLVDKKKYLLQSGDILFSHINSPDHIGKTAIYRSQKLLLHGINLLLLRPTQNLCYPEYLNYYFKSKEMRDYFKTHCKKAVNQASLNQSDLLELKIPLPPLPEQQRIATILQKADRLRRLRRYARQLSDGYLPSVFLEMFGDPVVNPYKHPIRRLKQISLIFSDGPFGSDLKTEHYTPNGIRVIRLQNIGVGIFINDDKAFISKEHFRSLSKHTCLPGDIIVGTLGEPNLRAFVQPEQLPIALNKADCVQIRVDKSKVTIEFVCFLLNMPQTLFLATGLIHGQTRSRINMGRLAELEVPIPNIEIQQKFSTIVKQFEKMNCKLEESERQTEMVYQSLLQRAFQGEL